MSEDFKRQKWYKKKLDKSWRKPRGNQNKLRKQIKGKGSLPGPGHRTPKEERGLHPSGLEEKMVFNVSDTEDLDPEEHAARIGGSVGTRKRLDIVKACQEEGIRVLNLGERTREILAEETDNEEDD